MEANAGKQSFWDHLDVLRAAIVKIVAVILYLNADADVAGHGCGVRDTGSFVAFRKTGLYLVRFYASLPETCGRDYLCAGCCHHPDLGCVYTLARRAADVGIV